MSEKSLLTNQEANTTEIKEAEQIQLGIVEFEQVAFKRYAVCDCGSPIVTVGHGGDRDNPVFLSICSQVLCGKKYNLSMQTPQIEFRNKDGSPDAATKFYAELRKKQDSNIILP